VDNSLRELGITGPVSLDDFEQKMDAMNWPPTMRIAAKIQCQQRGWLSYGAGHRMSAQTGLATDQDYALGSLATDRSQYHTPTPTSEATRLLERAKLPPTRSYSLAEVEDKLGAAGYAVEQRMTCKVELSSLGLLRKG
jgi:hypothetical protein